MTRYSDKRWRAKFCAFSGNEQNGEGGPGADADNNEDSDEDDDLTTLMMLMMMMTITLRPRTLAGCMPIGGSENWCAWRWRV